MQKQRMNRAMAFIASVGAALGFGSNNIYIPGGNKDIGGKGRAYPGRRAQHIRWVKNGAKGYGMALLSNPRYRAYKRKRNRRARAANGGVLPRKYA